MYTFDFMQAKVKPVNFASLAICQLLTVLFVDMHMTYKGAEGCQISLSRRNMQLSYLTVSCLRVLESGNKLHRRYLSMM